MNKFSIFNAVTPTVDNEDLSGIPTVLKYTILGLICLLAFSIRLFAVVRYESVIHEFDPYFNFRTTKYLAHEGFLEFLNWYVLHNVSLYVPQNNIIDCRTSSE